MHKPASAQERRFEHERLRLFQDRGFDGHSRWIEDRHGRTTYVIERGAGRRPTVLIHGGLSEASEWALLAGKLPGHVVIADRPGCGLSYRVDDQRVDYRQAAMEWTLDLFDGIGAEQVDLVANSMGGFFAIAFAVVHPERVRSLVLAGAVAGLHRQLPFFVRLWGNPITGPLITRMRITDPEQFRRRIVGRLLMAHPERAPLELLRVMIAAAALPGVDRSSYSMLRSVTTLRGWRPDLLLRDDTSRLEVPTRLLWGASDAFAPPSAVEDLVARMPDAELEVLQDVGHLVQLDAPETVARVISDTSESGSEAAAG
jgi:pimeloyl-ACP methyl ester carboxylesterase